MEVASNYELTKKKHKHYITLQYIINNIISLLFLYHSKISYKLDTVSERTESTSFEVGDTIQLNFYRCRNLLNTGQTFLWRVNLVMYDVESEDSNSNSSDNKHQKCQIFLEVFYIIIIINTYTYLCKVKLIYNITSIVH